MATSAAEAGGHHAASGERLPDCGGNPVAQEFLAQHLGRRKLITGRIGRVDSDELREQVGRFLRELVVVDSTRGRRFGYQTGASMLGAVALASRKPYDRHRE